MTMPDDPHSVPPDRHQPCLSVLALARRLRDGRTDARPVGDDCRNGETAVEQEELAQLG